MGLKVGDKVPYFKAKEANGKDFDSQIISGRKSAIIYFYPKDDTPQCSAQSCGFRGKYDDLINHGVEVIGIGTDSVDSHREFSKKYGLPFILLSDKSKKIRKLFGVPSGLFGLFSGRFTYVIDENGIVKMILNNLKGSKHISKALEAFNK